jgi:predicted oxidoreductase
MNIPTQSPSVEEPKPLSSRRDFLIQTITTVAAAEALSAEVSRANASPIAQAPETSANTCRIMNTDLTVSRLAYGCGDLVSREADPLSADIVAAAARLIHTANDNGITLFDMAASYGDGKVEAAFGEVLKQSPGLRQRIVIQTKCGFEMRAGSENYIERRGSSGDVPFGFDCSGQQIVESAEGSLRRLGTDRIDILLLHWPDMLVRPEGVAQALATLHQSGKVRYFGISNHTVGQMALLQKYVRQRLVINQIYLGLAHSYPLAAGLEQLQSIASVPIPQGPASVAGVVDYCRLNGIQVQAYSPIYDILKRKLLKPPPDATPPMKWASKTLLDMADQKQTTPLALALAWLMYHPASIVPVIGPTKPEHIVENCSAYQVRLDREDWFRLFFAVGAMQVPMSP